MTYTHEDCELQLFIMDEVRKMKNDLMMSLCVNSGKGLDNDIQSGKGQFWECVYNNAMLVGFDLGVLEGEKRQKVKHCVELIKRTVCPKT